MTDWEDDWRDDSLPLMYEFVLEYLDDDEYVKQTKVTGFGWNRAEAENDALQFAEEVWGAECVVVSVEEIG